MFIALNAIFRAIPLVIAVILFSDSMVTAQEKPIPEPLRPWQDWATWNTDDLNSPAIYSDGEQRIRFWPSQLELVADGDGATWSTDVRVFDDSWIPLPGTGKIWPVDVRVDDVPVPVFQRDGAPYVKVSPGLITIAGAFRWKEMPQTIAIPNSIGILDLSINGNEVSVPNWDADGNVWLQRVRRDETDKDLLSATVNRVIEDGIPLWLHTDIELTVSGKSREEVLGAVLPEGWILSKVESKLPIAVDDQGLMKAQVRAGKWLISVAAFRTTDPNSIQYAENSQPIINRELIALKTDPDFRISQIEGLPTIDASQTDFPSKWSGLPVYQWETDQPFRLVEKMRGMGEKSPEGLTLTRRLWLDEDGRGFTYQDQFLGKMQRIWRLDANEQNDLGAVRIDGESQLITANPQSGASGVEIRSRNLNLEAIGRANRDASFSATGWQTDVDALNLTLTMPPGWRALAVLGADEVSGDWLTAWSLLDLFLLLIFSLAVVRLYGISAGIIAFLAFGLAYHELAAPRLTWLFLLIPIALLRVVGQRSGRKWIVAWKFIAAAMLLLCLVPFVAIQVQSVIYPQLEPAGYTYGDRGFLNLPGEGFTGRTRTGYTQVDSYEASMSARLPSKPMLSKQVRRSTFEASNLLQDPTSKIQTGPARPQWDWNDVRLVWNGPVTMQQQIQPILLSLGQTRVVTVVRVILLLLLAAILLKDRKKLATKSNHAAKAIAAIVMTMVVSSSSATAQMPDAQMLQTLRQRLLATPDAFPNAAEIPRVDLKVIGNRLDMSATVHAALAVAVPLPGKLPAWSPVTVLLDGEDKVSIRRRDGFLWVVVPQGVHELSVSGLLPNESDWEWTFLLKPKYVSVQAEGWTTTGIDANGVPDSQVFFVREQARVDDQAAYDRADFAPIVVVDRSFELGLISKVRTVVTRLSSTGKAISLHIPLLANESVLTGRVDVVDNAVEVRMNAAETSFSWDSQLPQGASVSLVAENSQSYVSRWHLVTSPIWNVELNGLMPVFESSQSDLVPIWQPWPGESVTISLSKPTPVVGDIMTVQNVRNETTLGSRQRTHQLTLDLECSLANDFVIQLERGSEVSSLNRDGQAIPVQRDGDSLIIPARPGNQSIAIQWRSDTPIKTVVRADEVVLPVEASNVSRVMQMPDNRWVLWASGPRRGPAVRFWTILVVAVLASLGLGSLKLSPLRRYEWVLLVIGLTQVHLVASAIVIAWLYLLAWRGTTSATSRKNWVFDITQIFLALLTLVSLCILMVVVGEGLLGSPDMFIIGNGSSRTYLHWFQPRIGQSLPSIEVVSVSVWFYRLLMLCWALWLATALLRWLTWGWNQFSTGGIWRRSPKPLVAKLAE